MRDLRSMLLLAFALFATGCLPVRYVTQAAAGQEDLNRRGIAIREVVEGGHLDKRTRGLLAHVAPIKAFGERYGLKRTANYQRYVWINRPAVVWVVSACHPLAFRPRAWKFPIVGSITYTGWFDRKEAKSYADDLARAGWDVDLRPSGAYSTLGWFDDPILSTMIGEGDEALGDLADVVLHETLHATFYVPNQSTLNESVASFFGDNLALQYLDETVGPDSVEKASFIALRVKGERRGRLMKTAYEELARLYASKVSREEKLSEKKRITDNLRAELGMKRAITNATLIQYKTYGSGKAELEELLSACGGSFPRMLQALERVRPIAAAAAPHTDPGLLLRPVIAQGCR
ncbi:MAG TPA: aminopeptidase [Labilithrix sp.]|nr:aminopeptidase [Labilithrix sp.]